MQNPTGQKRRWLRTTLFAIAIAILACACSTKPAAQLSVGANLWIGNAPLYLARDLGYFQNQSLRLIELGSSKQVLEALRLGKLDAASLTLDETLLLLQEGVPLSVVWVMDLSRESDAVLARADISTLPMLRGHRVGVEQTGVGAFLLDAALRKAGLHAGDITVVPVSVEDQLTLWRDQQLDAVVTYDPFRQQLLAEGAVELATSHSLNAPVIDVLVVRDTALACCSDRIANLIEGQKRALLYLQNQRQDALQRLALRQGISPGEVESALGGIELLGVQENRAYLVQPNGLRTVVRQMATAMVEAGLLSHTVATDALIDTQFVQRDAP